MTEGRGETPDADHEGTESPSAKRDTQSPATGASHRRSLNPIEPPWYGPVCPVVWEGRSREAPPYPHQPPLSDLRDRARSHLYECPSHRPSRPTSPRISSPYTAVILGGARSPASAPPRLTNTHHRVNFTSTIATLPVGAIGSSLERTVSRRSNVATTHPSTQSGDTNRTIAALFHQTCGTS
jgi:hypothetical protein